jgi:hypothetical protein
MSAGTVLLIVLIPFTPWLAVTGWRSWQRYRGAGE